MIVMDPPRLRNTKHRERHSFIASHSRAICKRLDSLVFLCARVVYSPIDLYFILSFSLSFPQVSGNLYLSGFIALIIPPEIPFTWIRTNPASLRHHLESNTVEAPEFCKERIPSPFDLFPALRDVVFFVDIQRLGGIFASRRAFSIPSMLSSIII